MKRLITIIAFLFVVISCDKQAVLPKLNNHDSQGNYFVGMSIARKIAEIQAPSIEATTGKIQDQKRISEIIPYETDDTGPVIFVVNYNGGGFSIISNDYRTTPILAESETSSFPLNQEMPSGVKEWLDETTNQIKKLRADATPPNSICKKVWEKFENGKIPKNLKNSRYYYVGDCNNGDPYYTLFEVVDPMIATKWGQKNGYNEQVPYMSCSDPTNGHALTGCVATTMAQIMKYYSFPSSYNWSTMSNFVGSYETARLMSNLGSPNNLSMSYGCSGSYSYGSNVPRTFTNFGYPPTQYLDYDYNSVKNDLTVGRPVMLEGHGTDGHMWLTDGFSESWYYECQPDPNTPGEWISVYTGYHTIGLYMNWGWNGSYDGIYGVNSFNPGNNNFNSARKMIISIHHP